MASLADIERFLERIFERSTARVFRTRLQPVQLERRVERAMERARVASGSRTAVPARYRVRLNPSDMADVAPDAADAELLAARLADAALAFARGHAYHLPSRPVVMLVSDPSVARGQVEVDAAPAHAPAAPSAAAPPGPMPIAVAASAASPAADPAPPPSGVPEPAPAEAVGPDTMIPSLTPAVAGAGASLEAIAPGIRGDGTQTLVFRRPAPAAARAILRVLGPDGTERTVEVDGSPLDIGRSRDAGLVLADSKVSRRHGRLQARRGALVYTDLGSTNGSRVNGIRVDEIALGLGDRLQVGDTVLVVESLPG